MEIGMSSKDDDEQRDFYLRSLSQIDHYGWGLGKVIDLQLIWEYHGQDIRDNYPDIRQLLLELREAAEWEHMGDEYVEWRNL
jgi:hypothetical protein